MPRKPNKNPETPVTLTPELQALLLQIPGEEIATGVMQRPVDSQGNTGQSWTPADIEQTVRLETVPQMIKKLRTQQDLTLADVADKLGVSRGRAGQLEMEGANLQLATLAKLAHALGYQVQVTLRPESGEGEVLSTVI